MRSNTAVETGFHICLVLHHARRLGFDAIHQAQIAIDPTWPREQVLTLNRASTDIAAELGISDQTVRRHRRDLGITRETRHGMGKRPA